jgi:hypothetical protein
MKKNQNMQVWLKKMVLAQHIIAEFAVPTKSWQQQHRVQTCKKRV